MVKTGDTSFWKNNYTSTDILLGIILSFIILITSSFGFYLASKAKKLKEIQWHLPAIKIIASYWVINIFRLLYILPSLFFDIGRIFGALIWYNQICYIVQQYLILVISFCCVVSSFQTKFILPASFKKNSVTVIAVIILVVVGACYVLFTDILDTELAWNIANYSLLSINVISFIASLSIAIAYYFWHQKENFAEKCYRMSYAFVPFIMSVCFIVKHVIVIFSKRTIQYNGLHSHFTIIFDIFTLISSFGTFLVIRNQQPIIKNDSNVLSAKPPVGPFMT